MMLFQKPPTINLSSHLAATHHRRHPSAPPAVVVQPTRTPGLLSLSKPPRPSPQRQPQQQQNQLRSQQRSTPKFKPAVPVAVTPTPANQRSTNNVQVQSQKPAVEVSQKVFPTTVPTAEKSQPQSLRGRPAKAGKDKTPRRSASQSSIHGRRNHTRQPSPPIQPPPAEVNAQDPSTNNTIANSNLFDPFLDDFQSKPVRPTPALASRPSGKLAKRRQPIPPFTLPDAVSSIPTETKAVNVPRSNQKAHFVARSDPVPSHMPAQRPRAHRPGPRRASALIDGFPICDDTTEIGDESDADDSELSSTPVTPVRTRATWQQSLGKSSQFDDGPRTAPLSSTTSAYFPFNGTPSPTPVVRAPPKARKHRRAPSEGMGVFHMSSDEESAPSDELKQTLFGLLAPRKAGVSNVGLRLAAAAAAKRDGLELSEKARGFFASSQFQNSPSPEELPPPSF